MWGVHLKNLCINSNDESDRKSWVDSVLSICEGGSEAFNERMITYGEYGYYKH